MSEEMHDRSEDQKVPSKKPYTAPALKDYGSVRELTLAGWGSKTEGYAQSKHKRP